MLLLTLQERWSSSVHEIIFRKVITFHFIMPAQFLVRYDGDGENKLSVQESKRMLDPLSVGRESKSCSLVSPTEHEITFLQRRQPPRALLTP